MNDAILVFIGFFFGALAGVAQGISVSLKTENNQINNKGVTVMPYIVCQTKSCAQTYPIDEIGVITKDTKNVKCEKCGGILIDENGRGLLSQHPHVIPGYDAEEAAKQRRLELKRKREERSRLDEEILALEKEDREESEECYT